MEHNVSFWYDLCTSRSLVTNDAMLRDIYSFWKNRSLRANLHAI